MRAVGEDIPVEAGQAERTALEKLYLGDGWYRDGPGRRVDHYTGFAFHTYALLLHRFAPATDRGDHLTRARLFAPEFANWFDGAGRSLAFGRSMTYRFATVAFFGAYALADDDPVLDWGILKGIVLRNLRWWSTQPKDVPVSVTVQQRLCPTCAERPEIDTQLLCDGPLLLGASQTIEKVRFRIHHQIGISTGPHLNGN